MNATDSTSPPSPRLTIVGIGASAGGLAALKTFFTHVPADSGLAYVVVVHLAPDHESHLADLLQLSLKMPVQQVTKTISIEPDHVYVIPPGCNLESIDTHLRLSDLEEKRRDRAPIDHFFRTLAQTHDGHAVGVILTGTGSDGTLGIKEIKGQGGLTVVQDPNEAEFDGMPQSAIATGFIDLVLPLDQILARIQRFAQTQPRISVAEADQLREEEQQLLYKIFTQIRNRTGRDFSRYKRSTIMRRLYRRMQLTQLEQLSDYLQLLRERSDEVVALSDDFLITVTNFFRDPEVYRALQQQVVSRLFEGRGPEEQVRVWSVGCSSGEEAYSLAIILLEEAGRRHAARHETPPELQIFASDLHDASLTHAREGFYPGDIATDVSAERLRRFFVKEDGGYRVRKEVRDRVVFAPHNLLSDPPFSKLDLIVCRNVLIYLQRDVQRDIIDLFHYALRPDGALLLGTSETIENTELFRTEDKTHCLFRRRNVPPPELHLPVFPFAQARPFTPVAPSRPADTPVAYGALHQKIVERYAPPSLLVSPDYRVVHLSEHVGRYLRHPGGEATTNVFKLLPPELHVELRTALHAAREQGVVVHTKSVPVPVEGAVQPVVLSIYPTHEPEQDGFFVVIFHESEEVPAHLSATPPRARAEPRQRTSADRQSEPDAAVRQLETELDDTKQRLQAIIEEYETSQEEMKASNEEMQSTNEELRSTMEELETSKEELQSLNEELTTLNQENRHKVEELSQLSGDLQNLLAATDIATLFLDRQLRIMRFTPRVGDLFSVRLPDRGRPLSDLTHRLGYNDLQDDARRVLDKLTPVEREVQDEAGRWYLTRVLPYRSSDDRIEGVVITFVDITARKQSEEALRQQEAELRQSEQRLRSVLEHIPAGVVIAEPDGTLVYGNREMERIFQISFGTSPGSDDYRRWPVYRANTDEPLPPEEMPISRTLSSGDIVIGEEMRIRQPDGTFRTILINTMPIYDEQDHLTLVVAAFIDVTERLESQAALSVSEEQVRGTNHLLTLATDASQLGWGTWDFATGMAHWDERGRRIVGLDEPDGSAEEWLSRLHPEDRPRVEKHIQECIAAGRPFDMQYRVVWPDGELRYVHGSGAIELDADGKPQRGTGLVRDITHRKRREEELRRAKEEAERAIRAKEDFLAHMSHEIRTPLNAVSGITELMLRQDPAPHQMDNLRTLRFSAQNLKALVDDILDFSKIEAGKVAVEETEVDLSDLLRSLESAHRVRANEQSTELNFSVDDAVPTAIRTDSLKLSQILNNLLSNAIKFTKAGQVSVTVTLERQEAERYWLTFAVQDTGLGIAPDKLATIFDTFTQADISTVREYGGTGLGLSITKLLLELLGSEIEVESEPGVGSRFFFTLPVGADGVATTASDPEAASDEVNLGNIRVLLVEDVPVNRMILIQFLQEWWQFSPDEATNGQQAVEMAQQQPYDLILLDIRMPVMDGYQAAEAIRKLDGYADVPILALTADTGQEVEKHTEAKLFTDVVTKPFEPADLKQKLIRYTQR